MLTRPDQLFQIIFPKGIDNVRPMWYTIITKVEKTKEKTKNDNLGKLY